MKKPQQTTAALILFHDAKILNERPEGMTYEEYRVLRAHQTSILKKLFPKPNNSHIGQHVNGKIGRVAQGIRRVVKQRKAS